MRRSKTIRFAICSAILLLVVLALSTCDIAPVAGRYTYIVKYDVRSSAAANATVTYDNAVGSDQGGASETLPWSSDSLPATDFSFDYDYDNPFVPKLMVSATIGPGESLTFSIILKDYRTDFQEEVLESRTMVNNGDPLIPDPDLLITNETIFAIPLPK